MMDWFVFLLCCWWNLEVNQDYSHELLRRDVDLIKTMHEMLVRMYIDETLSSNQSMFIANLLVD